MLGSMQKVQSLRSQNTIALVSSGGHPLGSTTLVLRGQRLVALALSTHLLYISQISIASIALMGNGAMSISPSCARFQTLILAPPWMRGTAEAYQGSHSVVILGGGGQPSQVGAAEQAGVDVGVLRGEGAAHGVGRVGVGLAGQEHRRVAAAAGAVLQENIEPETACQVRCASAGSALRH